MNTLKMVHIPKKWHPGEFSLPNSDWGVGWNPQDRCPYIIKNEKQQQITKELEQEREENSIDWDEPKRHIQYFGHLTRSWLIGKDPDAGRDWGQEEKGTTEDEMGGWHHRLNVHEFEWTPGVGDGQGGLACCDSWGCKESDMTEQLNWTALKRHIHQSQCTDL